MKKKSMDWYKQQQRFSVRKYHFGAASVLLGTALVFGGAQASADEVTAPATPSTESTTATSAETTTASEGAPAVLTASEATPASLTASEVSSSTEATSLDKGALQVALSQAKALDLSNKTSETVAILLAQIEHAQTVLNTATSQEELNQAVADLQAAQAQLADKPAQPVAVSPASVATTSAPATSTTSSTPEATTPASVTASSTTPAPASTESSSTPAVTTRSRRTRRDTSASPKAVSNVSTASIINTNVASHALTQSWEITTKLTESAKEGDYVEYTYKNLGEYLLNGSVVKYNGIPIGTVSYELTETPFFDMTSEDSNVRENTTLGGVSGKIRVTFDKAVEDLTNVEYTIKMDNVDVGLTISPTPWTLTSSIENESGVIASVSNNIPSALPDSVPTFINDVVPSRTSLGDDNTYRGQVRAELKLSPTDSLQSGDLLTYTLNPSSPVRFDLSAPQNVVGYTQTIKDTILNTVNHNNVIVSSGKTMSYEVVESNDTKLVYRIKDIQPGTGIYFTWPGIVVTDPTGIDATNKVIKNIIIQSETLSGSTGGVLSSETNVVNNPILGLFADASAVQVPRADVYVQYVDEAGNLIPGTSKTLVLDDAKTGTAYTTTGLDSNTYPNYTFVKMQDGSAPATGNSTTADIVVTYVYHYNTEAERFTPNGQDLTVKHNDTPSAEDGIANKTDLPTGTTYAWKGTAPDTSTPGTKPATITVSYPDGSSEDVNVNVNVTPRADDYTPVGKDVPAKHGDTPNASDGIANKGDLPADATYTWKGTAPDTTTPGDKPATVVVTYDDGTVDEVPVTVKVQPQTDDYDPQAKPVAVDHGATPNAEDGIANKGTLPPGTTYDWKTPIDTSTPGTKPGTVVVTYPDGTKDEVPVPVTVGEQATLYTPVGQDVPAKHGETPAASQGIANRGTLPAGTTYDWKTPVDTSTPGDKPATVVVTYPDGSKDEVPVTVKVKPQSDEFTPNGQDVPTKHGETPNAADGIANKGDLPAGTTYDWKTPVDTTTPGDKPGTVVVTYPDGTKDEVPVTVKVKPQSDEFTPAGQDVPAKHGETPKAEDGITNKGDLPDGTKYDWKTPVDTTTPGDKPGTVVVTYPDGTKDEVPVTVKVKPQSDEFTPNGQDVPAKHGETPKAEDGITNKGDLPDGTKYDWKTPVDTTTPGDKPGTVVVTYPDGTKDEIPVTVKVKPQSDEFTPAGQDVPTKHGETPKAEDGIANKGDLPNGTKYDWKTPVDTTTPGDKPGTVVVTYPDGTKDEVPVTVKVKPQSDEFTPQPKDVSTDHGKTPKAEDGIANKGDLPDGTKYDWKTPVDTTTPGDKPGTVVVTYPDGTKDEIPVKVHVGSQSDLYNPDGQNLNVKQGDQPEASKGIANRGNLPDGTSYDWKTPVDTSTVGDKPATVVVTYPDGSKDEVPVTVKVTEKLHVKTPADKVPVKDPSNLTPDDINKVVENIKKENPGLPDDAKITVNPNGGDTTIETKDGDKVTIPGTDLVRPETDADKNNVKVPADKVPVKDPSNLTDAEKDKVKDNIKKANPDLPNGTKIDVAKDGTATITFPDGSTKVIPGTDLVRPETDADKNNVKVPADKVPVKDPSNLTDAEKDKVKDNIKKANPDLPNGTKIDVDKDGTATITFPDGSTKVIPGSDLVRPEADADKNNVKVPADKVPVKDPSNLTDAEKDKVKDNIKKANPDLPNGTKIDVAKDGTATITFPDGSTKVIPGTDLVRPETDADKNNVKVPADKVPVKDPSNLTDAEKDKVKDNIKKANPDLPNGTKIDVDKDGTATITFPDGSTKVIPGTDLVRPETDADKNNVKVPADKVPVKDPSNLTDAEKDKVKDNIKKANPDIPNGTKIDVDKDGTATITFPDGSTKVIPGSDLVRPETDADRHTPKGQDVPVKQGETPKAEDGIANKGDLPNGTKIEWKETPDTSKVGDHNATIVITYPDGSKDEVTVTVKVSPNANNNGHNGNNGAHGNGNSGSHNNGTNGGQGQGDKDKKDQAGKDTNNGLDKLFSNSGNGSASGDQSGVSRKQAPALPNTGDASNPAMALAFAALLGGTALAMKKRKKEEEE